MMNQQTQPRDLRRQIAGGWQRLPLRLKLLLPIFGSFLGVLLLLALTVPPTVNSLVEETIALSMNTEVDRHNRALENFLQDAQLSLAQFTDNIAVRDLGLALNSGAPGDLASARTRSGFLFTYALDFSRLPMTDIRFLDLNGQQVINVRSETRRAAELGSIIASGSLSSEADSPHFAALRALRPGEIYISAPSVQMVGSATESGNELTFQIGTTLYVDGQLSGYLIGTMYPRDQFAAIFQPSPATELVFTTLLLDATYNPMVVARGGPTPQVSVIGDENVTMPSLPSALRQGVELRLYNVGGQTYNLVSLNRLAQQYDVANLGWWLIVSKNATDVPVARGSDILNGVVVRTAIAFALLLALIALISQSMVRPLHVVSYAAEKIAAGDLGYRIPITGQIEVDQVASVMNDVTTRLGGLVGALERRVAERTRNVELAAQIGRDATQSRNINELLQRAVNTIRDRFGFYHAQVFLVDEAGEYAVLHTSTGEAGRELLARHHKLGVGSASIVGQVTEKRRPFITLDTQQSEVPHRFNPVLPLTRSEMALPLQVGDKLIGALDLQSVSRDAFTQDDVQTFQLVADQLAIAIDNARLLEEQDRRVAEIAELNRLLTRKAWDEYIDQGGGGTLGYHYDLTNVKPLPAGDRPTNGGAKVPGNGSATNGVSNGTANGTSTKGTKELTAPSGNPLTPKRGVDVPIEVRGEVVGSLSVVESPELPLTTEDRAMVRAVADRVALAIENVRLVEQTQNALARVEQLYQASRALGGAFELTDIYEIIAEQLAAFDLVDRLLVISARPEPTPAAPILEYTHVWERTVATTRPEEINVQFPRTTFPEAWLADTRGPHIADLEHDLSGHEQTHRSLERQGIRSLISAPLATPTRWFGVLVAQSTRPNAFNENFAQFFGAVSDQMAVALENRILFAETQAEARRNRILAEAAQAASLIGADFETGVANLLRSVAEAANLDRWWFGQVQLAPRGVGLRRVAANFPPESPLLNLKSVSLETDRNTITEAARTARLIIVNDPVRSTALQGVSMEIIEALGKHIVLPVRVANNTTGILLIGRSTDGADLDERDEQLARALAGQIAVATENRRLFDVAQSERETLQSVLNSLPTGVVVFDATDGQPGLTNEQARVLLGLDELQPYQLLHTSNGTPFLPDELPQNVVLRTQAPVYAEDMTVLNVDGDRTDLLVNVVPILRDGRLQSAVAVYQDVTELRELENVLQESLRETTTLYEVSRAIAAENDLVGILNVLAQQVFVSFAPDHFYLLLRDESGALTATYAAQISPEDGLRILPIDERPVPTSVLLLDEAFIDSNVMENPDLADDPQLIELGICSINVFPLLARSRVIGWLVIGFNQSRSLAPDERRTLGNMADQTAVAVESARLADQTAQALTTTTLLYEASLSISRADSVEATLEAICERLSYFQPDRIDIFLARAQDEERVAHWVVAWDSGTPLVIRTIDAPQLEEWSFMEAPAYFINDISTISPIQRELVQRTPNSDLFMAQASLPMTVKGRIAGRIVMSYYNEYEFTVTMQQLLNTIGDQSAISLDNFLLVQQTQESLDETAVLYQASRAIANAASRGEELQAVVDYAVQTFVNGAMILRLTTTRWDDPDAAVEVVASWFRDDDTLDMSGVKFTPSQFSAWPELSVGEAVWIEDIDDRGDGTPAVSDPTLYTMLGFRAAVIFPLTTVGASVGALLLGADTRWPPNEREARVFASLTDLLSISLERQRLLQQTERRAQQLQLSAQVAQSATSILNLSELFDQVVNLIRESFGYDHVQVFRLSNDAQSARVVASTGEAGRQLIEIGHNLPVGSRSVIGQVTATGMAQIVDDTTDTRAIHRPNPYLPNTRAEMALPLRARNRILGALDVQSNTPGAFTQDDVAVLSILADQIAVAVDNAELFATSNQRAEEMRFLFNATRAATAALNEITPNLTPVARMVCEDLNATSAALLLLDDARSRLIPHAASSAGVEIVVPPHLEFSTPYFRSFADNKEPINFGDVQAALERSYSSTRLGNMRLLQQLQGLIGNAGSAILVPLLSGANFLGMLVATRAERAGFSDDTLRLLQALTSTLSASIQNARLLREVQSANVRLMELDKVKNQFLANMSHELRTPLNSIIGFSRVILKGIDGPLTEMQEQDLQTIYDSGKHLLGLVNDILDQAKIEADRMEFAVSQFSMAELVKGVSSTAVGLLKDKPVRLHQEIDPALPMVWGDEFRTRQALLNLVSNAAKFTQQGSITVSAFPIEDEGKPMVQVSVSDTGIGIPADKLEAIFEPFQQVENSAARQYEGTGLGLPIARKLVQKQGGRMWVVSEVGVGSTFSLTMPVNRDDVPNIRDEDTNGAVENS